MNWRLFVVMEHHHLEISSNSFIRATWWSYLEINYSIFNWPDFATRFLAWLPNVALALTLRRELTIRTMPPEYLKLLSVYQWLLSSNDLWRHYLNCRNTLILKLNSNKNCSKIFLLPIFVCWKEVKRIGMCGCDISYEVSSLDRFIH